MEEFTALVGDKWRSWLLCSRRVMPVQDARLSSMVSDRATMFEAESRKMNTEEERIALEKTHVERDSAHLEASGGHDL